MRRLVIMGIFFIYFAACTNYYLRKEKAAFKLLLFSTRFGVGNFFNFLQIYYDYERIRKWADALAKNSLLEKGYKTYNDGSIYFVGFSTDDWKKVIDFINGENEELTGITERTLRGSFRTRADSNLSTG